MKEVIITTVVTLLLTAGTSFIVSLIKKGQFESWGIAVGKALSKIGDLRFGRSKWEKIEDALMIAVVSFAQGLKKGADLDDSLPDDEIKSQVENGEQRTARRLDVAKTEVADLKQVQKDDTAAKKE